jgi:hypothetical protein
MEQDIYKQVTDKIIADLEKDELIWLKPWSAGNMDGRIVKPLRHNGMPYNGINVLTFWGAAIEGGYAKGSKSERSPVEKAVVCLQFSDIWLTTFEGKHEGSHSCRWARHTDQRRIPYPS